MLERKSSQDLSASINDGRYAAQKWLMLQCGLASRFYLVETDGDCLLPDSRSKVRGSNQDGQCNTACMLVCGWGRRGHTTLCRGQQAPALCPCLLTGSICLSAGSKDRQDHHTGGGRLHGAVQQE